MRHRKDHRKLSRTASHRRAVLRNLVTALFEYERIETTLAKAKEARRYAERMITFGKQGDIAARRHVAKFVMKPGIADKLFTTIAPWYTERHGGYTRIIKIGQRLGDAGETAYLELVKSTEQKEQERQARLAAAEAKEAALKGDKATAKKNKAEAKGGEGAPDAPADKPRRDKKQSSGAGPAKRRGKTGVKTG
jgi:large subunit ribosomal protein L17